MKPKVKVQTKKFIKKMSGIQKAKYTKKKSQKEIKFPHNSEIIKKTKIKFKPNKKYEAPISPFVKDAESSEMDEASNDESDESFYFGFRSEVGEKNNQIDSREKPSSSSEEEDDEDSYCSSKSPIVSILSDENDLDSSKKSSSSDDDDVEEDDTDFEVLTFMATNSSCFIVAVKHPVTFSIKGTTCIKVVSGKINILGHDLDSSSDTVALYCTPFICNLQISTTLSDRKTVSHLSKIKERLSKIALPNLQDALFTSILDSHVIFILRQNFEAYKFAMVRNYIPSAFYATTKESKIDYNPMAKQGYTLCTPDANSIEFTDAHEAVVHIIKQNIRASERIGVPTPCILVYGNKGLGKSTSLRYFINMLLSWNIERILFLDIDPGQSEFTIPGCISLTEISEPLLGPSYTHLKVPVKCKFFGSTALENSRMYFNLICEIINYYKEHYANEILFINTAGWIKGLGKTALEYIQTLLTVTIKVELVRPGDYDESFLDKKHLLQPQNFPQRIVIPGCESEKKIPPSTLRSIAILSYFANSPPIVGSKVLHFTSLNALPPYCISALDIAIHVIDCSEFDLLKLSIINCAIVALCIVSPEQIIHCSDGTQPNRLDPESDYGDCIGFGFVRAIDVKQNSLYIVTPVNSSKLRFVNLLVKGNIVMPDEVFTKQALKNVEALPYMAMKTKHKMGGMIPRRRFRTKF